MRFPFSKGPLGPVYTIVHVQFSQNSIHQDTDQGEKILAECRADIAKDPAWSFTQQGQVHGDDAAGKVVLIISWRGPEGTEIPPWTSTSTNGSSTSAAPSTPFAPLLSLLDSPPQIINVAFSPPLLGMNIYSSKPIADITTLYIPAETADTLEMCDFGSKTRGFGTSFATVSHQPQGPMRQSNDGWGFETVVRKEKKMVVHILFHEWRSIEAERQYKGGSDDYENFFLKLLKDAETLGVEWEMVQVGLEYMKIEEEKGRGKGCCSLM